jgi:predicted RNA-binding Zn-ribbon protein involved in translation (DUF1610 family)
MAKCPKCGKDVQTSSKEWDNAASYVKIYECPKIW